jgi:hypothetical protein
MTSVHHLFNKLAIAAISVGLGSGLVFTLSTIQLTEADKDLWRSLDSAGCEFDSNTGVWCPNLQKRDR